MLKIKRPWKRFLVVQSLLKVFSGAYPARLDWGANMGLTATSQTPWPLFCPDKLSTAKAYIFILQDLISELQIDKWQTSRNENVINLIVDLFVHIL